MDTTSTVLPYFLYSTGILYREGLEALLVVIALVAATHESGQKARARDVYTGAIIALVMSCMLAWAADHFLADNTSDTLEGFFQLFAAATLFYVSSWFTAKSQARQWKRFISKQIDIARNSKGPSLALGLTAFLAVMREGAETIVFFEALLAGATQRIEWHAVMAGVIVGAIALAITFIVLKRLAYMIPIGPFFTVTSVLLYALAVIFVGQGIASFQESGVIGATFVSWVPTVKLLGLFPTVQTLVAQGILLVLAAIAGVVPLVRARRFEAAASAAAAATAEVPIVDRVA